MEGIEADVIRDGQDLLHFFRLKGRRIDVDFFAKFFVSQEGLVQSTGAATAEILPQQWEGGKHRKTLQR